MGKNLTVEEQVTIRYLRDKLDWYVHEASDMEYNRQEVRAMLNLLKLIDPPNFAEDDFSTEKAIERFWKTQELRKQIHEEMERMKRHGLRIVEFPNRDNLETGDMEEPKLEPAPEPKKSFMHRKISAVITAAALVIIISLSVTAGVYAERLGYFIKIRDDGKNFDVITTVDQDLMKEQYNRYYEFSEVPLQYTRFIWIPEVPDSMELKYIDIQDDAAYITAYTRYECEDSEDFIYYIRSDYGKSNTFSNQVYDGYIVLESMQSEDMEIKYMSKENDDCPEYIITIYHKNSFYLIDSNLEYSLVKNIADKYVEKLK